jgi:tRNA-(ms[2]io[6]A)-hydroxylase
METVRDAAPEEGLFAGRLVFALRSTTPAGWAPLAVDRLDEFLVDHAAAERKAHASCLMMVAKYPDRPALVESMLELAKDELQHLIEVVALLHARGLCMAADIKDPYIQALHQNLRPETGERLMDRLLLSAIVEARGCERFGMIGQELARRSFDLAEYYIELSRVEARHYGTYLRLAKAAFASDRVEERLAELLEIEGRLAAMLPLRPSLH